VIIEPEPHSEFGWQCLVHCEALRGKPMRVYGDEVRIAWAMGVNLVARLLDYAEWSLVDDEGNMINLPKIENEE
jgi:hypothetical protein